MLPTAQPLSLCFLAFCPSPHSYFRAEPEGPLEGGSSVPKQRLPCLVWLCVGLAQRTTSSWLFLDILPHRGSLTNIIQKVPLLPQFAPPSTNLLASLAKHSSRPSPFVKSAFFVASSIRQFSQTPFNMTSVYFDMSWEGPVLDDSFRPTGQVKRKQLPLSRNFCSRKSLLSIAHDS